MASNFVAKIIGIPHIPSVTVVNIRKGPGTNTQLVFQSPVGMDNLTILETQPDSEGKGRSGKTYTWFRLIFPPNRAGWVRDDLIAVSGDGSDLGYGVINTPTQAFLLTPQTTMRPGQEVVVSQPTTTVVQSAPSTVQPTTTVTTQSTTVQPTTTTVVQPTTPSIQTTLQPTSTFTAQTTTAQPTTTVTQATQTEPGTVIGMGKTGINVRPGPGTSFTPPVFRLPYMAEARILDAAASQVAGDPFTWIKISYQGKEGWVREDYTRLKGSFEEFEVGYLDQYSNPTKNTWWIRDFNLDPNFTIVHYGWDHGGNIGEPILAGPLGGVVIKTAFCAKCGDAGASAVDRGFSISDSRVLSDANWNYGYGHFVNVRYDHSLLPESTKRILAANGFAGASISVNYGHLQKISVQNGQQLQPNQMIGMLGNSGNSSGPHLHLEVRAHMNPNETNWASMKGGLMTPKVLFGR